MANLHHFQFAIDQKSIVRKASGGITIEGMASTDRVDRHGDVILPSAYEGTLETYMGNPQILLQHDYDKPIGKCVEAEIRENGLWIKAEITEDEDGVIGKIERGLFGAFSVGFFALAYEYLYDGRVVFNQDGLVDGATWDEFYASDLRRITKVDLVEVSVVSVPANPAALFDVSKAVRKALAIETKSLVPKNVAEAKANEAKEASATENAPEPSKADTHPMETESTEKNPATVAEASDSKTEQEGEGAATAAETVSEPAENAGEENSDQGEGQAGETPAAPEEAAEKRASEAEVKAVAEASSEKASGDFVSKSEHEATVKRLETALAEKDAAIVSIAKEMGEIYGTLAEIASVSREAHKTAKKAEKSFRLLPVNKGLASFGTEKQKIAAEDEGFFKALDSKVSEIRSGR